MKKTWKWGLWGIVTVGLVLGAYYLYGRFGTKSLPEGLIQANGRMEGDQVTVASKFPGRIQKLLVREGDAVKAGQILAQIEDTQIQARVSQTEAQVSQTQAGMAQARAKVSQAGQSLAVIEAQLRAARTALSVLRKESPLAIETAETGLAQTRSAMTKATAQEEQAHRDALRFRELAAAGTVDRHRSEMADLASTAARNDLDSAQSALTRAEKQLAKAQLGWDRVKAKEDEVAAVEAQARQAAAGLEQARAALEQSKGAIHQAQGAQRESLSVLKDLTIQAPISGVITTRVVDTGEVIAAGSPLLSLVDLDRLYLKVYVPEVYIGKLRLGLPARIYTDAFPDRPFGATVRYISSRTEFTPKEVQTPDERVKLVYAVKLYLDENPDHRLTPGLPADAVIRWNEDTPWVKPRW